MFDKETDLKWGDIDHPNFIGFLLNKFILANEMTDNEKKENVNFHVVGGFLKTYKYKEAWGNFWRDTDEENRNKFLSLPNFDNEIFFEITGIDVSSKKEDCEGKTVTIDGDTYELKRK